jgi:hypothetical protein
MKRTFPPPSSTAGDGSADCADIVVLSLGDLRECVVVEGVEGLDSTPVTMVIPVVTDSISNEAIEQFKI